MRAHNFDKVAELLAYDTIVVDMAAVPGFSIAQMTLNPSCQPESDHRLVFKDLTSMFHGIRDCHMQLAACHPDNAIRAHKVAEAICNIERKVYSDDLNGAMRAMKVVTI